MSTAISVRRMFHTFNPRAIIVRSIGAFLLCSPLVGMLFALWTADNTARYTQVSPLVGTVATGAALIALLLFVTPLGLSMTGLLRLSGASASRYMTLRGVDPFSLHIEALDHFLIDFGVPLRRSDRRRAGAVVAADVKRGIAEIMDVLADESRHASLVRFDTDLLSDSILQRYGAHIVDRPLGAAERLASTLSAMPIALMRAITGGTSRGPVRTYEITVESWRAARERSEARARA